MNRRDLIKAAVATGAASVPASLVMGSLPARAADATWNSTGAGNPVVPGFFADPSIYVFNGVYHLYCTTDGYGWDSPAPTVRTSTDLVRWSNAPLPLRPTPKVFWAPSMATKNGKYYLYYAKGLTGSFVAVADRPTGPFTEVAQLGGNKVIDPQTFVDDDGTTYLYYGGGGRPRVGRLAPNMTSFASDTALSVSEFLEGAFVFKRGGGYYLMSSLGNTSLTNYRVVYSRSNSPLGPFTKPTNSLILSGRAGSPIESPGHNSVLTRGRDYYIVYHRHDNPHSADGLHRQICVDRMTFNSDGTIRPIAPTNTGVGALPLGSPPPVEQDLAAGRPVTASSSLSDFPAGYACDGNNGTRWAATNRSLPQWIRVDLGGTYDIGRCETTMEYVRKKVAYRIDYSIDGSAWSLYADRTGGGGAAGSPLIDVRSGVRARYLRLTITGKEDSANFACVHNLRVYRPGGHLRLVNRNSGLVLDVADGSTADGGDVVQSPYQGAAGQQWALADRGDGYFALLNRGSGKTLDVAGGSTADGGDVV
ncbi:family 43 glycosylhydrolase [Streptomyces sp. NPDC000618]|uniref:family 43 glycosylhydrolase n=1 Tax=Streptomyces sp. NPDC000618 TaxID=3154265 RepID=UPI00332D47E4